jgi:hypothetical protein
MFFAPLTNEVRDQQDRSYLVPLSERPSTGPNRSFVPGTKLQHTYDSVSLKLLQGCLRKYHLKLVEGWQETETPPALAFGRDLHTCLETYHKCRAHGLDHETATRRVARLAMLLGERLVSLDTTRTKETLVRSVVWYLLEFENDPMKTAVLPNGQPAVELSFRLPIFGIEVEPTDELPPLDYSEVSSYFNGNHERAIKALAQGRLLFGRLTGLAEADTMFRQAHQAFYTITVHYAGHIDRVVHFGDEVYLTDYKTSKHALTLEWVKGFDRSTQFLGYYTAGHILASQPNTVFPAPPAGVLVDGLQLGVNFTRFARFPLRYSATQANEFLENFEALVRIKAKTASDLDLWPTEGEETCNSYRRRDGSGGCEFIQVCNAAPAARERMLKQLHHYSVWDPSQSR